MSLCCLFSEECTEFESSVNVDENLQNKNKHARRQSWGHMKGACSIKPLASRVVVQCVVNASW